MKLKSSIKINGLEYPPGTEVPGYYIYPFFLFHMLVFGGITCLIAYGNPEQINYLVFFWGGFSALIYLAFYISIFGIDEMKWMCINGIFSILEVQAAMNWLLQSCRGYNLQDYHWSMHLFPFLFFIMYTFLLRQAAMDLFNIKDDEKKIQQLEYGIFLLYVIIVIYTYM